MERDHKIRFINPSPFSSASDPNTIEQIIGLAQMAIGVIVPAYLIFQELKSKKRERKPTHQSPEKTPKQQI
jgi:hypothetical protein